MQMTRSRAQSIKCEQFWRLANQESVILPSLEIIPFVSTNNKSIIFPLRYKERNTILASRILSVISENRKLLSFSLR